MQLPAVNRVDLLTPGKKFPILGIRYYLKGSRAYNLRYFQHLRVYRYICAH